MDRADAHARLAPLDVPAGEAATGGRTAPRSRARCGPPRPVAGPRARGPGGDPAVPSERAAPGRLSPDRTDLAGAPQRSARPPCDHRRDGVVASWAPRRDG